LEFTSIPDQLSRGKYLIESVGSFEQSSRGGTPKRPSPLIPPDVRISRIRRTEGVSHISTRSLSGFPAALLTPDNRTSGDKESGREVGDSHVDFSHVDFDDGGGGSDGDTSEDSETRTRGEDGRSQNTDSSQPSNGSLSSLRSSSVVDMTVKRISKHR